MCVYLRLGCLSPGHGQGKVFRLRARVSALGFGKDSLGAISIRISSPDQEIMAF